MRTKSSFLVGIFISLFISGNLFAEKITLGYSGIIKTYYEHSIRVVVDSFNAIDVELEIVELPNERAQHMTYNGIIDGEISRLKTYGDILDNIVSVPTPTLIVQLVAAVNSSSSIVSLKELDKKKAAIVSGTKIQQEFVTSLGGTFFETRDIQSSAKMLESDRVDFIIITPDLYEQLTDAGFSIRLLAPAISQMQFYLWINKKHAHLVPLLDKEIKHLLNP